MYEAQELINSSGISQIGLGFFTALLTVVGIILKMVSDTRRENRETRKEVEHAVNAAIQAKESAEKTVVNTKNVSNGFAGSVLGEIGEIRKDIQELSATVTRHMEWHLEKERNK